MPETRPRPSLLYRTVARAAVPVAGRLLRAPHAQAGHRDRVAAARAIEAWAATSRDPARPLVWFHAASVGEGLQARAVLAALLAERPDLQSVVTRFSPSAARIAGQFPADLVTCAPYDRRGDVERSLAALAPSLLVFTKVDVWPEMATAAARAGARTALVAGTVDPGSSRLGRVSRWLTRPGYRVLDRAGAVSEADASRLAALGVEQDRIVVTGDPRVDSVLGRIATHDHRTRDPLLLVAGSTWRPDESILLGAFREVRARHPSARLWLVPHEPTSDAVASIVARATSLGLPTPVRGRSDAPLVVIEEMGVLAGLYAEAGMAYVGGGFGGRGVHSVLEPAAAGTPVIIGPEDRGVRDAAVLVAAGGLHRLGHDRAEADLHACWAEWLSRPEEAGRRGAAATRALEPDRGAAGRSASLLLDLLPRTAAGS